MYLDVEEYLARYYLVVFVNLSHDVRLRNIPHTQQMYFLSLNLQHAMKVTSHIKTNGDFSVLSIQSEVPTQQHTSTS